MTQYVDIEEFNTLKSAYVDTKKTLTDTVELLANALKRISQLENTLYAKNEDGEIIKNEDNKPILNALVPIEKPLEDKTQELPIIPETTLEHKACAIVEHLKEKVKPRNDAVFMKSSEIIEFLKTDLPENLRLKEDVRNPRQVKKDILEKAVKLFSDTVFIIKNKSGNKVTGIALKPSGKRRDTYGS
jgi:hypothetical protein